MNDGDFVIFYIKNNQLYPVLITKDEHQMLQLTIPSILSKNIKIVNEPQGIVTNLKEDL